jgi:UDP-N-acetylmuramate--alanine ligase
VRHETGIPSPVHLIGVGGAGMSGIAAVLARLGVTVTGSDLKVSRYTRHLEEYGVPVCIGHDAAQVGDAALVVISSAIPPGNPELQEARRRGLPVLQRAEMLARIMATRRGVAVAGTHGKTTTSSMITHVMLRCERRPTFLVGGDLNDVGSNAGVGDGEWLVAEADESDGSLLFLRPEVAVVTNVELDHHANYRCLADVHDVFRRFAALLPAGGRLVVARGAGADFLAGETQAEITWYGLAAAGSAAGGGTGAEAGADAGAGATPKSGASGHAAAAAAAAARVAGRAAAGAPSPAPGAADLTAEIERADDQGSVFVVFRDGERLGRVTLRVPGEHNVLNALAALGALAHTGVGFDEAAPQLATFSGAARRYQEIGRHAGVVVIDDYAHHPTEVAATLKAARSGSYRRVIAVFQPHLFSRTRYLQREFGRALTMADEAIVTDIFPAREEPEPGVTGKLVVDAYLLERPGGPVFYLPRLGDVVRHLRARVRPGDLVLTIGAGDVLHVGERLLAALGDEATPGDAGRDR